LLVTVDVVLAIVISVCHAIDVFQAYLHSRDIIHRDLNSHNCLIKEVMIIMMMIMVIGPLIVNNS